MDFEIKMDYTIEDFDAYWRGFHQKRAGWPPARETSPRVLRIGSWFFLIGGAISLFAWPMFLDKDLGGGLLELCLSTPLGGVLELVIGFSLRRQSRRSPGGPPYPRPVTRMWEQYRQSGVFYNCCFAEDGFWVHDSKSDCRYDYAALESLWEDGERFYLEISGKRLFVLRKSAFVQGSSADFPAFWTARTGKGVGRVNGP